MRGQRATGKIQRNNYHHGSCGPSLTGKTMSVFLIFTQGTHRNVKNRWVRSSLKDSFPLGGIFRAEQHFPPKNVMSMRSSSLLCIKFLQKNSFRWRKEVENCLTFQRCRTEEKDLNMAITCWELQWGWYVTGFQLMEGQERVNIVKNMREVQFTSIWKKTSLRRRKKCEIHWQAKCYH